MEEVKKQRMESLFCPYEQALELKELGFDETCFGSIDQIGYIHVKGSKSSPRGSMMYNIIDCPTFSQAFRFFREKYKLHSCIVLPINKIDYAYEIKNISENIRQDFLSEMQSGIIYNSYEEAELACIRKLIEIVKKQNIK